MDATSAVTPKSWLNLSDDELVEVATTGKLPEGFDWSDLADHPQFDALFRFRDNPAKLANAILESQGKGIVKPKKVAAAYVPALPLEYREKRLRLKQAELEVQRNRAKLSTVLLDKVRRIESRSISTEEKMDKLIQQFEMFEEILTELRVRARLDKRIPGSHRQ